MKTFVINMDRDTDRLERLKAHFKDVGVSFDHVSRFPAIDGRFVHDDDNDVTPWCTRMCTGSMKGCGLSHLRLWRHCLDTGYDGRVLIFEDDVRLDPDWQRATENALCELDGYDPAWDVLLLGSLLDDPGVDAITKCTETVAKPKVFGGTHAYVVSARGLRNLVDAIPKVSWHIDVQMAAQALLGNLRVYIVSPVVAHQAGMEDTSMVSGDAWPVLLNRAASRISTFDNVPLNYWLTVPIAQVAPGIPINAWTLIAVLAGLAAQRYPVPMWSLVGVLVVGQIVMTRGGVPLDMVLGVLLFLGLHTLR